jgi:epoxyqueuosine reductase QueG
MPREMDYNRIEKTPGDDAAAEAARVYYELGEVTIRLAEYIRSLGYPAFSHHPLGGGALLLIPCAIDAGLGEEGRNSLVISREFGPRFRLGCVTTDLPLQVDRPASLGVREYCEKCRACLRACPSGAIPESRQEVRGIEKYTIDVYRCRQYRQEAPGCAICIKECILNQLSHRGKWLKAKEATLG